MEGFIYQWIDSRTGLKYIGRHKGTIDDGYIGSGTVFIESYTQRSNDFSREILWHSTSTSKEELIEKEREFLSQISDDELWGKENTKYYNQTRNSIGDSRWESRIKKYGLTEVMRQLREDLDHSKAGCGNKGKNKTAEHKEKIRNSIKRKHQNGDYNNAGPGRKQLTESEMLFKVYEEFGTIQAAADAMGLTYNQFHSRWYRAKRKLKK